MRRQHVRENLFLAHRGEHVAALIGLDLADLRRDRGPLVQQLEDVQVVFVDLTAERREVRGSLVGRGGGTGFAFAACHVRSRVRKVI